jgi:hypothetical protein
MIENFLNFFRNSVNIFDYFSNISEFLCMVVSIYLYKTYKKNSYYIYFLLYTIAVVIVETLGSLKTYYEIHKITYEYDIFGLTEYILIALIYYNLTNSIKNKKIIILSIVSYIFFHSILFFDYGLRKYIIIVESVLIVYLVINYFINLLNSEEILNYKKQLPFWLSVGFLLFFLSAIPFFSLLYSDLMKNRNLFPILHVLIVLYNSCFIYGLIICRKVNL